MEKAIADRWFGTHPDGRATDCRVGEVNKLSRAEALLCFVRHPSYIQDAPANDPNGGLQNSIGLDRIELNGRFVV